jgi:hypothetical protein
LRAVAAYIWSAAWKEFGKGGLAHDVSILLGIGRHLSSQPGAKVSITIRRPPQHGQGQGSDRPSVLR